MAVVVTAEELSSYLKVPVSTVCRLASKGELPGFRMRDSWQFDMDEIIDLINAIKRRHGQAAPELLGDQD